jgi:hypothetical protein
VLRRFVGGLQVIVKRCTLSRNPRPNFVAIDQRPGRRVDAGKEGLDRLADRILYGFRN